MATEGIVHVRIDETVRREASQALAEMGLSISDAVRMLLIRVAREKAMPFEVRVPTAESARTLEELRRAIQEGLDSGPGENLDIETLIARGKARRRATAQGWEQRASIYPHGCR